MTGIDADIQAARSGAALFLLPEADILDLQAPELRRWANGMFTNNITRLRPGQGNRSAMCDDRGRVQGLLDLYCIDDQHFVAVLDGIDADAFLSRYRMFLILDEIEVEERPNAETLFAVQGPEAEARLLAVGLPLPALPGDHLLDAATGTRICRKDRSGLGGFDLLVPGAQADALQSRLHAAGLPLACAEALDALRILAGRARWPQDGSEKSMVHELGVNTEVCNFEKGCYVGQEIINRIDVKGAIQKRITALVVDGPEDLAPGTPVLLGEDPVGQVSSVARIQGQVHALGVLRKAAWAPGTALTVGDAGRGARVKG